MEIVIGLLMSVLFEETLRHHIPRFLRQGWMLIAVYWTWKLLETRLVNDGTTSVYGAYGMSSPRASYAAVAIVSGVLGCAYWWGIGKGLQLINQEPVPAPISPIPAQTPDMGVQVNAESTKDAASDKANISPNSPQRRQAELAQLRQDGLAFVVRLEDFAKEMEVHFDRLKQPHPSRSPQATHELLMWHAKTISDKWESELKQPAQELRDRLAAEGIRDAELDINLNNHILPDTLRELASRLRVGLDKL
jgi:hypothetical protein